MPSANSSPSLLSVLKCMVCILPIISCGNAPLIGANDRARYHSSQWHHGHHNAIHLKIASTTKASDLKGRQCSFLQGTVLVIDSYIQKRNTVQVQTAEPVVSCHNAKIFTLQKKHVQISYEKMDHKETFVSDNASYTHRYSTQFYQNRRAQTPYKQFFFPLYAYPLDSYTSQGREFGAWRNAGRRHAANDLLVYSREPVYAVAQGRITDFYEFYQGTYAIVVDHHDFIVRYGEVEWLWPGLSVGSHVSAGQKIARAGTLWGGSSMLHFEQYSGSRSGPLTMRSNYPFQRRKDLVNPTRFLQTLERSKHYPPQ